MRVLSEQSVPDMLGHGLSLSRFGDGEFKMLRAESDIDGLQKYHDKLRYKLLNIFLRPLPNLLIGIPNPLCTRPYVESFHKYFDEFISGKLAKTKSTFVSSFFTRPSLVNLDSNEYFEKMKNIWREREIVLINFNFDLPDHFLFRDNFCDFIEIPRKNCFSEYKKIITSCYKLSGKGRLFLISAGPVASCLVYDLYAIGEQAIDIGQLAFEYDLFKGELNPAKWTSQNAYRDKRGYLRGIND